MKNDSGFVEFSAVLLLFFIAAVIAGGVLYASSAMTFSRTDKNDFDEKLAADLLLDKIIEKIQPLRLYMYDDENNEIITSLCREYDNYGLQFADVSSGYHLDFLSDEDVADNNIVKFLFHDNTGAGFTAWRDKNGLSASKTAWKEFIKEEAWAFCVSYGWLHKDDAESFAFRSIRKTFSTAAPDKLFPLVNYFPRMNVNMVNPDMLRPLIMRGSFKVEKPVEKADALISKLRGGPVLHSDISSVLKIPANHPLMGYFGTKTAFWKVYFAISPSLRVEAVVAAIPKKDGGVQEIQEYRLIDRRFFDD